MWDVDGNEYIDYVASWGPMIIGHCHPAVNEAVAKALENGASFGAPTELEIKMARPLLMNLIEEEHNDAILGAAKQMHTVIEAECTGCELCLEPCPVDCIDMVPLTEDIFHWKWPDPDETAAETKP